MGGLARALIALLAVAAAGGAGWYWWQQRADELPPEFAVGNGRIEATQIDIATKFAGRIAEVLVREGDEVTAGQVLARMDIRSLQAELARAEAEVARARQARAVARAEAIQRQSELRYAAQELERGRTLVERGHISQQELDRRRTAKESAEATLTAAQAGIEEAEKTIEAAEAEVARIETEIEDGTLRAPIDGRVQYRLADPGEVLPAGGRVVTLLELTDVYMTIFLPTGQAGRLSIGAEGRIILDAAPGLVIPGSISFVAAEAQFTPKEVETRSEREKLMFRVKVQIPPELLRAHSDKVKTGLPGVAYVRLDDAATWPARLAVKLPQ